MAETQTRARVIVVGGGFAGLAAARGLKRAPVEVTLFDSRNHHLFQPLLYQVASAQLSPSDIATPIRRILRRQANAEVFLADVLAIDLDRRQVKLADNEVPYDYLVLAAGAVDSYFGHDEWAEQAPGLKSLVEAVEIRSRVLYAFEAAERATDADERRSWLSFAVVGGGPTGVELAGALAEIAFHTVAPDFRRIDAREARVVLIEAGERLLPAFTPRSSANAQRALERLGVTVRLGTKVTDIDELGVHVGKERIASRTKIWAAGVRASPLTRTLGVGLDSGGRVAVEADLSIPGHPEAFAVGDLCAIRHGERPVPGVAPAALQEGRHAARNIVRRLNGEATLPFRYLDKGSLATIGRASAVAEVAGIRLSGWIAWMTWLVVHIFFLIGFRNRILVVFEWAWAYLTFQRGARLITIPPRSLSQARRGQAQPDAVVAVAEPAEQKPS